ncbi:MAG: hypothetical protein ACYDAQ_00540 [Mycobacteriales bacterium]
MTEHDNALPRDFDAISVPIDDMPAPPAAPLADEDSDAVLTDAVSALTTLRFPLWHNDAATELHVLASLATQIHGRIPHVVAAARDQGHDWKEIATCLGETLPAARLRYRTRTRPTSASS